MRASALVGLSAALLGLAVAVNAGDKVIASPVVYLSTDQFRVLCSIRNVGRTEVAVTVGIFGESGEAIVPLLSDDCNGAPLAPGAGCLILTEAITNGVGYACTATASKVKDLRGEVMLMDNGSFPARSEALR